MKALLLRLQFTDNTVMSHMDTLKSHKKKTRIKSNL